MPPVNDREKLAHDMIVNYVAAKWPRYALTSAGEALLATEAERLASVPRITRVCHTCGADLARGRVRYCGLSCWRAAQ